MKTAVALVIGLVLGIAAARLLAPDRDGRAARAPVPSAVAADPASARSREPLDPVPAAPEDAALHARLEEIRARLEAIEARLERSERRPLLAQENAGEDRDELRSLVETVLIEIEDREQREAERRATDERARAKEEQRAMLRFKVGVAVANLSEELNLRPLERQDVLEALLRREERRMELKTDFDPLQTDPATWQARWDALDDELWRDLDRDLGLELTARVRQNL